VAAYRDSDDLARGMYWLLCEADRSELAKAAVRKVAQNYSQSSVALRYSELYQEILAQKHFRL
jgi:spore maturation protein CgeB